MQVDKDKVVAIDYKLTDDDGQVLDSSEGREPLQYVHGSGGIIPGLERELHGKNPGEEVQVTIPPEEGYGQRNDALTQQVPREQFAGVDDLQVGMQFQVQTDNGPLIITVTDIQDDMVTVDGNHQLAGMNLNFDVKVREVRDATAQEIEEGQPQPEDEA